MAAPAVTTTPAAATGGGAVVAGDHDDDGGAREALRAVGAAIRTGSATARPRSKYHDGDAIASPDKNDNDDDDEWLAQLAQLAAPQGHFPPLWAVVTRAVGLSSAESAYVFLLGHAKAVAGASVRAGVMGPYQVQALLASAWLRTEIQRAMDGGWRVEKTDEKSGWWWDSEEKEERGQKEEREGTDGVEEAGQGVPTMDLWIGRHELLYSRIFNS